MTEYQPDGKETESLYERLTDEAEACGYHLNPDVGFTKALVEGLLTNQARYGYWACPCRLADGEKAADLDIICPCDYRDADLNEFGACYCRLYVSQAVLDGKRNLQPIPERRPPEEERGSPGRTTESPTAGFSHTVWRCKVCGYLCARDNPPEVCPICRAKKERFEKFA